MGNRSYLITPEGRFETNNSIAPCWFLIFDRSNFKACYSREFHPDGDEWTWPDEEEVGEEGGFIGFYGTVAQAQTTMERKLGIVSSDYVRGMMDELGKLHEYLDNSPPNEEIICDMGEWAAFYESIEAAVNDISTIPDRFDQAIQSDSYTEFIKLIEYCGYSNHGFSGLLRQDKKKIDDIPGFLLGWAWDKKDQG